ncbi:MAG: DUF885 domain-containing protein [Gammaproteobacteria bacterium]|nr:DUF885 domain-containing protein [Gammaproteobacteria bacterium]
MKTRAAVQTLLAILLAACGSPAPPPPPATAAPAGAEALTTLTERYFEAYLELNPVAATFIGDHRFDDRMPPADHRERAHALEQAYLDELARIDRATLAPAAALDYDVFAYGRRIALESFAYPGDLLPLDQFNNTASFFAQLGSGETVQPFATMADYDRFAARMRQFPDWVDRMIGAMRTGIERGIVQPRVVSERLLPQLAAQLVPDAEASIFWQPLRRFPDSVSAAERERLTATYRELIGAQVIPAYRRLHDFVRDEYLAKSRSSVGLGDLPGGADWYAYLARAYTTTEMPVEEIHQTGLREVARLDAEIARVMQRIGFRGDVQALAAALRDDDRFHFRTAGELLDAYRSHLARVTAATPRLFGLMPKAPLEIRPIESFREQSAAGAEYYQPSADGTRPGIFYVNTYDLPARPAYEIETIFLHEAIPGHHFQIALVIENPAIPRFRRFGSDDPLERTPDIGTAYAEGWGLYAESLGEELGFYTDPYQKLGNLFAESWRAVRLVVDTGMHAKGWTREQAIDYMLAHTAAGRTDATAEIERYIAWPGQALAYKIGQMTIRSLRTRAEREFGARFDVREFHARVLEDGALPLGLLEAKIDRWIATRKSPADGS